MNPNLVRCNKAGKGCGGCPHSYWQYDPKSDKGKDFHCPERLGFLCTVISRDDWEKLNKKKENDNGK